MTLLFFGLFIVEKRKNSALKEENESRGNAALLQQQPQARWQTHEAAEATVTKARHEAFSKPVGEMAG